MQENWTATSEECRKIGKLQEIKVDLKKLQQSLRDKTNARLWEVLKECKRTGGLRRM